jgi:cytolysin (calcineurin-like family phosphatase)
LVCLNLGPGTSGEFFNSLAFLASDLATNVGSSGRPVIIYFHYPIGCASAASQNTFYNIIKNYNIVAIFHGHVHIPELQMTQWQGFDVYNVGTFHTGKFTVAHLRPDGFAVAEYTDEDSWGVVSLKNFKS